MSGTTAALSIGLGLLFTLILGMASQVFGRSKRTVVQPQKTRMTYTHITHEQQEDLDAVSKSIEDARAELLWLRDQVVKERARLDKLKREAQTVAGSQPRHQQPPPGFAPPPPPRQRPPQQVTPSVDSPWVILGLRPGSSSDDIRRRYRLLSRVWHPDRFTDGPPELRAEAEMMMARLNRAHNTLKDQAVTPRR